MFKGTAEIEDRSLMNICFLLKDDSLKKINNEDVSEYTKKQLTHIL